MESGTIRYGSAGSVTFTTVGHGVLGPLAKETLTAHFATKGGYYGAGHHQGILEMYEQQMEGARVLRDRVAPIAATAPATTA